MSKHHHRNLRQWVLDEWGDGTTVMCVCCLTKMTVFEITLDRFPVPGKFGGTYCRDNVRPMCLDCNSNHLLEPSLEFVVDYMLKMHGIEFVPSAPRMSPARAAKARARNEAWYAAKREQYGSSWLPSDPSLTYTLGSIMEEEENG